MKIWLDDSRPAPKGWTWVQTPDIAIWFVNNHEVSEISLDHDLGLFDEHGREMTGYDVLTSLERMAAMGGEVNRVPASINIHTANPAARKRMQAALDSIERLQNG